MQPTYQLSFSVSIPLGPASQSDNVTGSVLSLSTTAALEPQFDMELEQPTLDFYLAASLPASVQ
jgi:hypothetical protein